MKKCSVSNDSKDCFIWKQGNEHNLLYQVEYVYLVQKHTYQLFENHLSINYIQGPTDFKLWILRILKIQ